MEKREPGEPQARITRTKKPQDSRATCTRRATRTRKPQVLRKRQVPGKPQEPRKSQVPGEPQEQGKPPVPRKPQLPGKPQVLKNHYKQKKNKYQFFKMFDVDVTDVI